MVSLTLLAHLRLEWGRRIWRRRHLLVGISLLFSRLARITQRRSLDDMTEYFATVARDVQTAVVALPSLDRSGLVWEPGIILTARTESRFPVATILSTPGGDIGVAGVVFGPHIPIATVRMSDIHGLAAPLRRPTT